MGNKVIEAKNLFNEMWNEKDYPTLESIYNLFSKYIKEVLNKEEAGDFFKETIGLNNTERGSPCEGTTRGKLKKNTSVSIVL